jgi:hypothetical protein
MKQQRVPYQFRNPHQRAQILRRSIDQTLDAERGVEGGTPHFDNTRRVERKARRHAMHGFDHWMLAKDACRCAGSVLEVAEIGARSKRTTPWVCTLRERV